MKKRRIFYTILAILLIACIPGTIVYSLYSNSCPAHVTIVVEGGGGGGGGGNGGSSYCLSFYEDIDATTPCTLVEYGDMERDSNKALTFYIKNCGTSIVTINSTTTLDSNIGSSEVLFADDIGGFQESASLAVGSIVETKVILSIKKNAPLGDVDFTVIINVI